MRTVKRIFNGEIGKIYLNSIICLVECTLHFIFYISWMMRLTVLIHSFGMCDSRWLHCMEIMSKHSNNKMIVRKSGVHWNVMKRSDVKIWTTFKHILEHQSLFMCNLHWSFIYCTILSFLRVKGNFDCRHNDHSRISTSPCIFGLD